MCRTLVQIGSQQIVTIGTKRGFWCNKNLSVMHFTNLLNVNSASEALPSFIRRFPNAHNGSIISRVSPPPIDSNISITRWYVSIASGALPLVPCTFAIPINGVQRNELLVPTWRERDFHIQSTLRKLTTIFWKMMPNSSLSSTFSKQKKYLALSSRKRGNWMTIYTSGNILRK